MTSLTLLLRLFLLVMNAAELADFLLSRQWLAAYDEEEEPLVRRLAGKVKVAEVTLECLPAGDAEIQGRALEAQGELLSLTIAVWGDRGSLTWEADCPCRESAHCHHAYALLQWLAKHEKRVSGAFGEAMETAPAMIRPELKTSDSTPGEGAAVPSPSSDRDREGAIECLLRVERRPSGERSAWLPEWFATAWAIYEGTQVALSPSGKTPLIQVGDRVVRRDQAAESQALQLLYALDLLPQDAEPPASLKKLEPRPHLAPLWVPQAKKWPQPQRYWMRFRHEAAPALERRGWQVRYAHDVGCHPLVFRSEGWKAEIVEEGKGWFHLSAGFEIEGETFELQPILVALLKNHFIELTQDLPDGQEFMVFLPDGRGLAVPVGRFRHLLKTLENLMQWPMDGSSAPRMSGIEAAVLSAELEGRGSPVIVAEPVRAIAPVLGGQGDIAPVAMPAGIKAVLRAYQAEGYTWMQFLATHGLNGILADDMGLGKTLQTLTHLQQEKESGRAAGKPSLVIAPTSVVMNWQREAARFAPELKVLVLQGPRRREWESMIPASDLVLSSFALLPRDVEWLGQHEYHLFALDEAQHIKNEGTQIAGAVRKIRSCHRLCLSGTPIENHLGELWALMDFLMPGYLGTREAFRQHYQLPIEKNRDAGKLEALSARLSPLILRRTKHDVAKELPPKTEMLHEIEMSPEQKDLYETVRSTMDKQVREAMALRGHEASIVFLNALLQLRQICCHPRLLAGEHAAAGSAKFDYLKELLGDLLEVGHRILIFSQFTTMLELVEQHLEAQGISYLKLTGATKDRQSLVERFQGGEAQVFLISLKAGGTGLTLTGADTVIHYDPWWNPAAENQATDRAYRIGQDKPVVVHKLICQNTVEEKIQQMQERKGDMADDILAGALASLTLSEESVRMLLSAGTAEE